MFSKQTIEDVDVTNKTVLLRADYNVPLDEHGVITDDYRILQSLPTIRYLLERQVRLIICAHLGRPTGPTDESCSLFVVAKRLAQLLETPVEFATDCVGDIATKAIAGIAPGQVILLENLRFHPEEEANDDGFAAQLAEPADLFVQDGFGVVHRAHASTEAITHHLPSVAGLLLKKEVDTITRVMEQPERPLMAVIGGAKIADKIEILHRFIGIADFVAIGGAMANTFLAAEGVPIGESLYEKDDLSTAKDIISKAEAEAKQRPFSFMIPYDAVVAEGIDAQLPTRIVDWRSQVIADIESYPRRPAPAASQVSENERILDIGPFSGSYIAGAMQFVRTVIWNGTMGVTEMEGLQGPIGPYAHGTDLVMEAMLGQFGQRPFSVVGGGDTAGYVAHRKLVESFDHVSTGGGASLELMSGKQLPGVNALLDKQSD